MTVAVFGYCFCVGRHNNLEFGDGCEFLLPQNLSEELLTVA